MRKSTIYSLLAVMGFYMPITALGQVHVTVSGAGNNNGNGWANAISGAQLQPMLSNASAGTVFWIAAGIYKPHSGTRNVSFVIPPGVKVYGGFAGNETSPESRDWKKNVTILSGDIGTPGDKTDNSYIVVRTSKADNTTLIDGCTIKDAYNDSPVGAAGGMYLSKSAMQVRNCTITENTAKSGGGIYVAGGYHKQGMWIDNCVIAENEATEDGQSGDGGGGGILSNASTVVYTDCLFRKNKSAGHGAGLQVYVGFSGGAQDSLENCLFEENDGVGQGGGIYVYSEGDRIFNMSIHNSRFIKNTSGGWGGGLAVYYKAGTPDLSLYNCLFEENEGSNVGGVYYMSRKSATVSHFYCYNNSFRNNTTSRGDNPSGLYQSVIDAVDTTEMVNCIFYNNNIGNYAQGNGKLNVYFLNNTIFYNNWLRLYTFIWNRVDTVTIPSTTPQIKIWLHNSILWYNGGFANNLELLDNNSSPSGLYTTINIKNSNIKGEGKSWHYKPGWINDNGNNYEVYPGFVDTSAAIGNLRLRCSSPLIDRGANSLVTPYTNIDLDMQPRIANTNVDLGAYENDKSNTVSEPEFNHIHSGYYIFNTLTKIYDSLRWDFGDGHTSSSAQPSHTYKVDSNYKVCLKVYSSCGNDDSCFTLKVKNTAITNVTLPSIKVYPNPANKQIIVDGLANADKVMLYDLTGRVLMKANATENKIKLPTQHLQSGVYYLRITRPASAGIFATPVVIRH